MQCIFLASCNQSSCRPHQMPVWHRLTYLDIAGGTSLRKAENAVVRRRREGGEGSGSQAPQPCLFGSHAALQTGRSHWRALSAEPPRALWHWGGGFGRAALPQWRAGGRRPALVFATSPLAVSTVLCWVSGRAGRCGRSAAFGWSSGSAGECDRSWMAPRVFRAAGARGGHQHASCSP